MSSSSSSCKNNDESGETVVVIPTSLSNEILVAATKEAEILTDKEREVILGVLTKDEQLRRQQQIQIMHLKAELQNLRRKGAIKVTANSSNSAENNYPDLDKTCGRCRIELGRVINRGAFCTSCRLKVCKSCREYNFRATDWVCVVCYKRMEIQAASGEWMNEFVRRPSRKRDARVYVPAADIIKKTIRRSWTISNPTPRWTVLRNSIEARPFSSLPRDQDILNYPSLVQHQTNLKKKKNNSDCDDNNKKFPTERRTVSEDVYPEHADSSVKDLQSGEETAPENDETLKFSIHNPENKSERINPLISVSQLLHRRPKSKSPIKKNEPTPSEFPKTKSTLDENIDIIPSSSSSSVSPDTKNSLENKSKILNRHVSFDNRRFTEIRSRSLSNSFLNNNNKDIKNMPLTSKSLQDNGGASAVEDNHVEQNPENHIVELCDIEPLSGTVFRKMSVRRRRQQNMRKMTAVDSGWRRNDNELFDILLPDGEDYRLVFVNSDSSSKEEDVDDNDSSSASSFPIDECDWDYFEPGIALPQQMLAGWGSPVGSPRECRKRLIIDSPLGSPLLQRRPRIRESSDEDIQITPSPSSASSSSESFNKPLNSENNNNNIPPPQIIRNCPSDDTIQCIHHHHHHQSTFNTGNGHLVDHHQQVPHSLFTCKSCGCRDRVEEGTTKKTTPAVHQQYIPVPVPIPIPFPVPYWTTTFPNNNNNYNFVSIYNKTFPHLYRSSSPSGSSNVPSSSSSNSDFFWQYFSQIPGFPWTNLFDKSMIEKGDESEPDKSRVDESIKQKNDEENSPINNNDNNAVIVDVAAEIGNEPQGHLECENRGSSASDSTSSIDSSDDEDNNIIRVEKKTIQRVYHVSGSPNSRDSDDALPSSNVTSDNDDEDDDDDDDERDNKSSADEKEREDCEDDDDSSSGSCSAADTDSNDTGTVADEKPRRFSKVFVVNKKSSNSSSESEDSSSASSSSSDDDSDNDTDTELDCEVILVKVNKLNADEENYKVDQNQCSDDDENDDNSGKVNLMGIKYIDNEEVVVASTSNKLNKSNNNNRRFKKKKKSFKRSASGNNCDCKSLLLKHEDENLLKVTTTKPQQQQQESLIKFLNNEVEYSSILMQKNFQRINCDKNDLQIENNNSSSSSSSLLEVEAINENIINNDQCNKLEEEEEVDEQLLIAELNVETKLTERITAEIVDFTVLSPRNNEKKSKNNDNNECSYLTKYKTDCMYSSSPGLSDVSAESLSSSDVEKESSRSRKEWILPSTATTTTKLDDDGSLLVLRNNSNEKKKEPPLLLNNGDMVNVVPLLFQMSERTTNSTIIKSTTTALEYTGVLPSSSVINEQAATEHHRHHQVNDFSRNNNNNAAAKYTSLVMITNDDSYHQQVNIVTTDTTKVVTDDEEEVDDDDNNDGINKDHHQAVIVVSHTNRQNEDLSSMDNNKQKKNFSSLNQLMNPSVADTNVTVITSSETLSAFEEGLADDDSWVENLSYDDDEEEEEEENNDDIQSNSMSENSSSGDEVTLTCSAVVDHEEELRGYHRTAIDFTLHTIVEESCEESEIEQAPNNNRMKIKKDRPASATDLEKYFFFGLGDNTLSSLNSLNNREDAFSETSSIYSEGMESLGGGGVNEEIINNQNDNSEELASSRLEKYFLSGFMGFTSERKDSDGSVGSDSEGKPSPEQRRKRLVRARGTGRSHSNSLDNLLGNPDLAGSVEQHLDAQINSEDSSSSDSDTYDEIISGFDKSDNNQFDTVKRKKSNNKIKLQQKASVEDIKNLETTQEENEFSDDNDDDRNKTPQPSSAEIVIQSSLSSSLNLLSSNSINTNNNQQQQSRDSGFVGSCDDLLKEQQRDSNNKSPDLLNHHSRNHTDVIEVKKDLKNITESYPPATNLTRKDSFNNWSSDEETNLMMCKMRQFFKTMVANNSANKPSSSSSSSAAPIQSSDHQSPKPSSLRERNRCKPPQLVYFENELTRLMKTVPGIRDDQVREIVEYLSSEDTWSDSYDSSDYTSNSDLEGGAASGKSALQQQISDSCKQIINKFDNTSSSSAVVEDEEGDAGDGGISDDCHGLHKETVFVYQKLMASFEKIAISETAPSAQTSSSASSTQISSPPLIAKVMHHIGSRLVALMHEVSSGESHTSSNSPNKGRNNYHRRLQQKLSNASTVSTTTDDDSTTSESSSSNLPDQFIEQTSYNNNNSNNNLLPRSKSHDLLMGGDGASSSHKNSQQSVGGEVSEEREASDCERFSWRGSFESALLATDSRNRLSLIGGEGSASASALAIAAKRRSAGDLLFSHKSLSREQLDRVRSCGSIGGNTNNNSQEKLWVTNATSKPINHHHHHHRRRASVPDSASCGSGGSADDDDGGGGGGGEGDEEEDDEEIGNNNRATLPRSMQITGPQTTNSLPRLPTTSLAALQQNKAQSHHFLSSSSSQNVKSARYRPPGITRIINNNNSNTPIQPKRAVSAPGLQPAHQRRGRKSLQSNISNDEVVSLSEAHSSPMLSCRSSIKSATPSPVPQSGSRRKTTSLSSQDWSVNDEDVDRLVSLHQNRSSLSSLGLRSDSMASVYSGADDGRYGSVTVRGQVEFGLQYNYKASALEIQIKQCKDLASVDAKRNRSDPYVKVYLLPDKSKAGKRKTKVKKHTLNPVFDECLKFHMSINELELRTLWLSVWHSDMFGRNDFLGEVMMTLENKVFDDPMPKWYNLQERTEIFDDMLLSYKGDIIVGLKFVPPDMTVHKKGKKSRGALHVLVKEAKSLNAVKANGTSDPFCKSYLLPDKGRNAKQKTPVIRKSIHPVWKHTFIYDDVTLQDLAERSLELTVWDHDRLASNEFLGMVRFSLGTGKHYGKAADWMDSTGKELNLWKNMLERPNFWVEGCLPLRSSAGTRIV